jgi:flagellar secretion chaperone FliS
VAGKGTFIMASQQSRAYMTTSVQTADPLSLVIALYEKAIASITNAMEAIENGDVPKRRKTIQLTSEIIATLTQALDFSHDGTLAGSLFKLYNSQLYQLYEANRSNDLVPLQSVRSTLSILLDGWQEVARSEEAARFRDDATRFRQETLRSLNIGSTSLAMMA